MKKLSYKEFRDFLDSDLDEISYFSCNKISLISLKEYLEELKLIREDYLNNIHKKNKWVKQIGSSSPGRLTIYGKNDPWIPIKKDSKTGFYKLASGTPLVGLGIKNHFRSRVIENSKEELKEIGKLADEYFGEYYSAISASEYFSLQNNYLYTTLICNDYPLFSIDREIILPDDFTYGIFSEYYNETECLSFSDKQKLIKKLNIRL